MGAGFEKQISPHNRSGGSVTARKVVPLLAIITNLYALGVVVGVVGLVGWLWNVVLSAYRLRVVPDELLGRVSSVSMLLALGALPLGSLAAGYRPRRGRPSSGHGC
jgi:hypothetical protein